MRYWTLLETGRRIAYAQTEGSLWAWYWQAAHPHTAVAVGRNRIQSCAADPAATTTPTGFLHLRAWNKEKPKPNIFDQKHHGKPN